MTPSNPAADLGMCVMYIAGISDMHAIMVGLKGGRPMFCFPEDKGISAEQQIRIFLKYAAEHPEQLNQTARIIVPVALASAFPCKAPKPQQ